MSRLRRYTHALVSGYALLGANVVYSLLSVPLALIYLTRTEFGLWCLVIQISGYVALVDVGMSGSVSRILVDYKDHPADGKYGSVIVTASLVGLAQGLLVLLIGCALALIAAPLLRVPPGLERQFMWLTIGQSVVQASLFATRVLTLVLTAHQRYDLINWSQVVLFVVNYGCLWIGFAMGWGVYSAVGAQAAVALATILVNAWWCLKLRLLPPSGQWGHPTWSEFREVFLFGKDVFLFMLGAQMVNATQTILVTPCLGLEAAGVWSVCTRSYSVVSQFVWRILDYSPTSLAEMIVRGEKKKLHDRFRSITVLTGSLAVFAAVMFALCNQPFVAIWTKNRFGWPALNDALLGYWLVLMSVQRCHCGLLGVRKHLGTVKYVYFLEGTLFVGLAFALSRWWSFSGVIISSIVATSCLSLPYGMWCTKRDFGLTWNELWDWLRPAAYTGLLLVPLGIAVGLLTVNLPLLARLIISGGVTVAFGLLIFLRWGLDRGVKEWLAGKLPVTLHPFLQFKRG